MSILVTPETKILIQGITGDFGGRHARLSLDYGTQVGAAEIASDALDKDLGFGSDENGHERKRKG